jgi:hypothetical protein
MPLKYTETQLALKNYFEALSTLKRLGIVPNKKDFTSQIGEWLVNEIYNGALALNCRCRKRPACGPRLSSQYATG